MAIVHTWAHGSRRLLGSGHRTSSTSQAMSSPARYLRLYSSIHGQDSLFSSRNVLITDATVKRLRCGWTLCPASLIVRPWLMTWSTKVACISSEIWVRAWPLRPWPCPHLPLPLPLALPQSMLAKFLKWLKWGLFVAGWLVFSFASECL